MQPHAQDTIVIASLEDLLIASFVVIDDLYQEWIPRTIQQRPGPRPSLSDSEVLRVAVVGELFGMEVEARWYALIAQHYRHLFPGLNERSRFNRRRRDLWSVGIALRDRLGKLLGSSDDPWRILDSFPLVVARWGRRSQVRVAREEAAFGRLHTEQVGFFGYRVHLLITLDGVISTFVLTRANAHDSTVAEEAVEGTGARAVLGDKAYSSQPLETALAEHHTQLVALRRRDASWWKPWVPSWPRSSIWSTPSPKAPGGSRPGWATSCSAIRWAVT